MNPEEIRKMQARFALVTLDVDSGGLPEGDRAALAKLIEAAQVINRIFLSQMWAENSATFEKMTDPTVKHFYWFNKGPWSDLDEHVAFLEGVPARKPLGAAFYPEDMSREEFATWAAGLSAEDRREAEGFFTLIVRDAGGLKAIPYSEAYRADLAECAGLLREAAGLTENATLRTFLQSRAAAFLSNDYYESDLAWMDVDASIDITIGPYETYVDELFGYKASFEAYIGIRDDAETARLDFFGNHMQELEDHLPIDAQYRNPSVGSQSAMRVVNLVFAAGDGDQGVKAAAFNLPNDERVITQKGSKRVMLKNVQEAKFQSVLLPIAKCVLDSGEVPHVQFDAFFEHILAHEMGHGIGPHQIVVDGRSTTPRQELKELYSAIEEVKADILGLFILQHFADKGYLQVDEAALYATYLASSFRTMRFGLNEAHGKGMAIQFNSMVDRGVFVFTEAGWRVDSTKVRDAVRALAREILMIEALGDYEGAKRLCDQLGVLRPEMAEAVEKIGGVPGGIPVDIDVTFAAVGAAVIGLHSTT